jgi:putative SOS response-associated peptidase YedK
MCGRFTASFEFREIKVRYNLGRDLPLFARRYNIAPSQEVPVIVQEDGVNELKPMRWGPGPVMGAGLLDRQPPDQCKSRDDKRKAELPTAGRAPALFDSCGWLL